MKKVTTTGSQLFAFASNDASIRDLAWDSGYIWGVTSLGKLKKYTVNGVLIDSIGGILGSGWGLTYENKNFWVANPITDSIYQIYLSTYVNIDQDSVKKWRDSSDSIVIVDVREKDEFESKGRIAGSVNLPWLSGVLDTAYHVLSSSDQIIVVCQMGGRSALASAFLYSKGYQNVNNMLGGMDNWHYPVEVGGTVSISTSWEKDKSPYTVAQDIMIDSLDTLTIKPDVVLKFKDSRSMSVYGVLKAIGTPQDSIIFESADSIWGGIKFFGSSPSFIKYCKIDSVDQGIFSLNSSPEIRNSRIWAKENSIHLKGNAFPTIDSCVFVSPTNIAIICDSLSAPIITDNLISFADFGIVSKNGANPQIHYNNISHNILFGVSNEDSSITIDAGYNWWGDKSGPYDSLGNPQGKGDTVSFWVDYAPWLGFPNPYLCGDVSNDGGITLADVIWLANYILKGGPPPVTAYSADVDCDESISLADVVFLANYVLKGGVKLCDC